MNHRSLYELCMCFVCVQQEDPEMVEGDNGEDAVSGDEPVGEQLLAKYYMVRVSVMIGSLVKSPHGQYICYICLFIVLNGMF